MALNINKAVTTDYSDITAHAISSAAFDVVQQQDETAYINERFLTDWDYFMRIPKLKSAILMKAIWTVGKGYETDARTKVICDHIIGNGKQTFKDILFNLVVTKQIGRDSFAEIIRDDGGKILNLKILDPSSMRIIFDKKGMIKRYEQVTRIPEGNKTTYKLFQEFKPNEIFHLSNNCLAGQMHGISVPETVEKIVLADDQNFNLMQKVATHQAVPFIIFKLKTDDTVKIATFAGKIKDARQYSEDMIIPDDENLLSWEVVQINPSAVLLEWRNNLNNQFYQAVGMPLILFGSAGTTESGGKIEYLGHETVFECDQLEIEAQIEAQLGLKINLNSPTSLLESLKADEGKDAQNALSFQPADAKAGSYS